MQKLLLLILVIPFFTASAQKIEGTVYDNAGKVLPFASVLIKGTQQGVTANTHGNFSFALSPGNYTLVCMHVGYATQEKSITLGLQKYRQYDFALRLAKTCIKRNHYQKRWGRSCL